METNSHPQLKQELEGKISLKLSEGKTFDDFCVANIPNYESDRFEAVAVRFYWGNEVIITVYALDKFSQEKDSINPDRIPVKKFKMTNLKPADVLSFVSEFNFTLQSGNYELDEMEIINK